MRLSKEIPASTVDALKRAHDAGHFLFINTGRTYCSVPVELKKLPFDGYLCGCGIYFTFDEEIIFEKHLDPERGDEIADYMTKCQIDGILREQKMCISLQEFQDLTGWKYKKIHGITVDLERALYGAEKMSI